MCSQEGNCCAKLCCWFRGVGLFWGQRWDIAACVKVNECIASGRFLLVPGMRTTLESAQVYFLL